VSRRSPLVTVVRRALAGLGTPCAGETVVAALSGGPDSVALLDALVTLGNAGGFRVVAAHLDHALRPGSDADARFCAALCAGLGVPFHTAVADVRGRAARDGDGLEAAARQERYAFLSRIKDAAGAVVVAVAHTRDDQAETVLLRLLRGAGSVGLAAMRPRAGDVIRPLLRASRTQVLEHLALRGLDCCEDPSNGDPAFLRNRVRHEPLPYLEARFNPRICETLARSAELLADEAGLLAEQGAALAARAVRPAAEGLVLSRAVLAGAPRAVARLAVRQALTEGSAGGLAGIGALHVERLLDLAAAVAPSGRRLPLPGRREAVFHFDEIHVAQPAASRRTFAYPLAVPGQVDLPGGERVVAEPAGGPPVSNGETAVVAADEPLMVRTRRPGDRIRTRGREVSLRRFLMARRIPADQRGSLPLVAAGHNVLWIPGQLLEAAEGRRYARLSLTR